MRRDAREALLSVLRCSPGEREEGRRKCTPSTAVDSAVIGISICICPSAREQSWRLPAWDSSSITRLHLSARISLLLPGYCCECVSHLAAVCNHGAHLSLGPLLNSPLEAAAIIHWRWADWQAGQKSLDTDSGLRDLCWPAQQQLE